MNEMEIQLTPEESEPPEILERANRYPLGAIEGSDRHLFHIALSLCEVAPHVEERQVAQPPLDMPVPQSPSGASPRPGNTPSPGGGGGVPARPTVIER